MGVEKPPQEDADLLAALDAESAPRPGVELARRLVKMNPAMKPTGMNTAQAADQLVEAMARAKENVAGRTPAKQGAPAPAAKTDPVTLMQAIAAAKSRISDEQKRISAAQAELSAQRKELDDKLKALEQEQRALATTVCDAFIDQLQAIDPNMTSPKTNVVLKSEAVFLKSIGFSLDRVVERERK
jgi:hypothetical protein